MSMHLIRGVREGSSKKKLNRKPGWKKAQEEHNQSLRSMGIDPDKKGKKKNENRESYVSSPTTHSTASTSNAIPGTGPKKESPVYSGDYIVGIATMHKSNLVPVGRGDDPKHYATMRRN